MASAGCSRLFVVIRAIIETLWKEGGNAVKTKECVCVCVFSVPDNMNEAPAEKTSCARAIKTQTEECRELPHAARSAGRRSSSSSLSWGYRKTALSSHHEFPLTTQTLNNNVLFSAVVRPLGKRTLRRESAAEFCPWEMNFDWPTKIELNMTSLTVCPQLWQNQLEGPAKPF